MHGLIFIETMRGPFPVRSVRPPTPLAVTPPVRGKLFKLVEQSSLIHLDSTLSQGKDANRSSETLKCEYFITACLAQSISFIYNLYYSVHRVVVIVLLVLEKIIYISKKENTQMYILKFTVLWFDTQMTINNHCKTEWYAFFCK